MTLQQVCQRRSRVAAVAQMVHGRERETVGHIPIQADLAHVARAGLLINQCTTRLPQNCGLAACSGLAWHEMPLLPVMLIGVALEIHEPRQQQRRANDR